MNYPLCSQVARTANKASGYDWLVTYLTDFEPSATMGRIVVSYNGLVGKLGDGVTIEVNYTLFTFSAGSRRSL